MLRWRSYFWSETVPKRRASLTPLKPKIVGISSFYVLIIFRYSRQGIVHRVVLSPPPKKKKMVFALERHRAPQPRSLRRKTMLWLIHLYRSQTRATVEVALLGSNRLLNDGGSLTHLSPKSSECRYSSAPFCCWYTSARG